MTTCTHCGRGDRPFAIMTPHGPSCIDCEGVCVFGEKGCTNPAHQH